MRRWVLLTYAFAAASVFGLIAAKGTHSDVYNVNGSVTISNSTAAPTTVQAGSYSLYPIIGIVVIIVVILIITLYLARRRK